MASLSQKCSCSMSHAGPLHFSKPGVVEGTTPKWEKGPDTEQLTICLLATHQIAQSEEYP
eukprot:5845744-Amphidinium_carterae.1